MDEVNHDERTSVGEGFGALRGEERHGAAASTNRNAAVSPQTMSSLCAREACSLPVFSRSKHSVKCQH